MTDPLAPRASAIFTAQYSGDCTICFDRLAVGDAVRFVDGGVAHAHHRWEKTPEPCPSCHLVHAGDCW